MNKHSKILVVGHNEGIENSLVQYFRANKYSDVFSSSALKLELLNQKKVLSFFDNKKIDYVFLGSIRSGGIAANQRFAAEFIYENLESQNNVIHAAYKSGVKKLLYFMSSCAYPKECPQPIKEEYLLTASLEETSEPYSVAKIAGVKFCQTYKKQYGFEAIVAAPATIYGPGSDMDLETAHVMGALIGKFYRAVQEGQSQVVVWGNGEAQREFLFMEDFVKACIFLMDHYNDSQLINVGCGYDVTIKELASMIKEISGFKGKIVFDRTKPDGAMKKLMNNRRITKLGWKATTDLKEGIQKTYQWYSQLKKRS